MKIFGEPLPYYPGCHAPYGSRTMLCKDDTWRRHGGLIAMSITIYHKPVDLCGGQ
jgi:hypothetical protein